MQDGYSALGLAACYNRAEILVWFLHQGIDCNALDARGWSALMWAANSRYRHCAQALLSAGADTTITTPDGMTALDLAREYRGTVVIVLLEEHERLREAQLSIKPAMREAVLRAAHVFFFCLLFA
eukprot:m.328834 g.328834  ORF g.328834 m.328834 type:complete len:125 (+) comp55592_c0_seq35:247-621(+)